MYKEKETRGKKALSRVFEENHEKNKIFGSKGGQKCTTDHPFASKRGQSRRKMREETAERQKTQRNEPKAYSTLKRKKSRRAVATIRNTSFPDQRMASELTGGKKGK